MSFREGQVKGCGVEDVAFHKKRGLRIEEMVKSTWVYRQLRNFRAGIEAGISCLKRAYGLSRCTWNGPLDVAGKHGVMDLPVEELDGLFRGAVL